ncbi:MAG: hypothetical protein KDK65_07190, partial [Chlamydiia bacterium]|nr:hypothetical protein [Chlamydiia bacterium]
MKTNPFQQRIAFWLRIDERFRQLVTVFRGKDFNQAKELYDQMSVLGDRDDKPLKDAMMQRTDQKLIAELQLMIHSLTATQIGELLKLWGEFTVKGPFYEHLQFMDQHHHQVEEVIQEFLKQIQKGSAKEFFEQEFSKEVLMILIRALSPKVKQEVCQQLCTLTCPSPLYLLAVRDLVKMIRESNLSGMDALLKTLAHARLLAKGEPLPPDALPYSLPLTGQFVSPHAGSILSQTTVGGEGLSNQVQTSIGLRALYPDPTLSRVLMEERHAYPILDLPDRMCVRVKINDRPFVFDFSSTCPGIRQMVTTLHQVLFAEETPTALVSFPEGAQGMSHDFAAMIVALPYEHTLAKVWSTKQHFPITMSSFTRHLLTALCAHYTADTPQAYSLVKEEDSYRLLHSGIDGAFAPEKNASPFLSPLMCCPEMNQPLDLTTVQCFLQHRVEEVLLQWMGLVWQQKMQSDRVFMDRDLKI